jgi:hypothetical protein
MPGGSVGQNGIVHPVANAGDFELAFTPRLLKPMKKTP